MNNVDIQEKANDELKSLADRISKAIQAGKFTAAELQAVLAKRSKKVARKTDALVHEFAWTAVGMGVGLGFLMGMLAVRAASAPREFQPEPEKPSRGRDQDRDEKVESSGWDKFQTILPLAVLALRTFQELRGERASARTRERDPGS